MRIILDYTYQNLENYLLNWKLSVHDLLGTREAYREGNGTPLQYSCLENPMGGGAW